MVSVANYTREDARQFLALAAEVPLRTYADVLPFDQANDALRRLRRGELDGAAVLRVA